MSVAGGLRQHRRDLSVLVDLGEHRRKWSTEMVWGKKKPGNIATLAVWDKRRKSVCYHRRPGKHGTKSWKRVGFLCPATHRTTISCRSSVTGCQCGTYEYSGDTWSSTKEQTITSCKGNVEYISDEWECPWTLGIDSAHLYEWSLNRYLDAMDFMQIFYFLLHVIFAQTASFTATVTAERLLVLLEEWQSARAEYRVLVSYRYLLVGTLFWLPPTSSGGSGPVCSDH